MAGEEVKGIFLCIILLLCALVTRQKEALISPLCKAPKRLSRQPSREMHYPAQLS